MMSSIESCRADLSQPISSCRRWTGSRTHLFRGRLEHLHHNSYRIKFCCTHERRTVCSSECRRSRTTCSAFGSVEHASRGSPDPMKVKFREVDTFSLWVWLELHQMPSDDDLELLDAVLSSWFMIGRLGGYNAMNLQAMFLGSETISFMKYDHEHSESAFHATFHDMGSLEHTGNWCRCWFNLGTADELALDVLINALINFSHENVGIKQCLVGGVNTEWPVPNMESE